jgi:hypothetical protein
MKNLTLLGFIFLILNFSCNKISDDQSKLYIAKIVDFDYNCSTCILTFPQDSLTLKSILGVSSKNYYTTVNLNMDEFKLGQLLKVDIRRANENESGACINYFLATDYKTIYVTKYEDFDLLALNDTNEIPYKSYLHDPENQCYIYFDSVLIDSRCPEGLLCLYADMLDVNLRIENYSDSSVSLHLCCSNMDTNVFGYNISLIDLLPHPTFNNPIPDKPEDYIAKVLIK